MKFLKCKYTVALVEGIMKNLSSLPLIFPKRLVSCKDLHKLIIAINKHSPVVTLIGPIIRLYNLLLNGFCMSIDQQEVRDVVSM